MPFITSENAKELGRIGGMAERKQKSILVHQSFSFAPSTDAHAKQTLSRVRKQIRATLTMLEAEQDAQKIDRLASALARLNEIERQLANRPLPGSWKPVAPGSGPMRALPIQVEPESVASQLQNPPDTTQEPKPQG